MLLAAVGRKDRRIAIVTPIVSGAGGLYFAADSAVRITGGASPARWVYVAGGLAVAGMSLFHLLRRTDGFDPLIVVSQQLAIGVVAFWFYSQLSGLALDYHSYQRESVMRNAGTELSLVALALAGVGLGVERTWRPAADRLGWSKPKPWHLALGLGLPLLLALSNIPLVLLMSALMPGSQAAISNIEFAVFHGVPAWSLPLIAVMAGAGEETLYRGALQPRFGIVAAAALFALAHIQYGPTFVVLWVFGHGLILGLIRRHVNTTTAAITHATYDMTGFMGAQLFGGYAIIALGLLAYLVYAAAANREAVWTTLKNGFRDDWNAHRLRSYLSPRWT